MLPSLPDVTAENLFHDVCKILTVDIELVWLRVAELFLEFPPMPLSIGGNIWHNVNTQLNKMYNFIM